MVEFKEGEVVIIGTGQAGTVISLNKDYCVLLANGDLWYGFESQMRYPQSKEDLDACPLNVDRFADRK
jgi:hypothetical protein